MLTNNEEEEEVSNTNIMCITVTINLDNLLL